MTEDVTQIATVILDRMVLLVFAINCTVRALVDLHVRLMEIAQQVTPVPMAATYKLLAAVELIVFLHHHVPQATKLQDQRRSGVR